MIEEHWSRDGDILWLDAANHGIGTSDCVCNDGRRGGQKAHRGGSTQGARMRVTRDWLQPYRGKMWVSATSVPRLPQGVNPNVPLIFEQGSAWAYWPKQHNVP